MTFFKSCFSLTQFLVMALGRGLGLVLGPGHPEETSRRALGDFASLVLSP